MHRHTSLSLLTAVIPLMQAPASRPAGEAAPPAYGWVRALPYGSGAWETEWTPSRWPLAIRPVSGPGGRIWMVGGAGVWHSADGIQWTAATRRPPWGQRYGAVTVFFRDRLWSMGGTESRVPQGDVWHSADGARWERAARSAPWSARTGHAVAVFRDTLWLLGGSDGRARNDVWASADGLRWSRVTEAAPWLPREGHRAAVFDDKLWVVGSGDWASTRSDVWSSSDGRTWTQVTGSAPWGARVAAGVQVFDGRLWVFGGARTHAPPADTWLGDVWSSPDGVDWRREPEAPWSPRVGMYSVVHGDRLWLFGGKGIESGGRGGYADDIWYLTTGSSAVGVRGSTSGARD